MIMKKEIKILSLITMLVFLFCQVISPVRVLAQSKSTNKNLALRKSTTQSSTEYGGESSRAVDGNTSGYWTDGTVTHTALENEAWWMVDLGGSYSIGDINIYSRTDGAPSTRLDNYYIYILDENKEVVWTNHQTIYPTPVTNVNAGDILGRYVKIQLADEDYLSLAEVQVFEGSYPEYDKSIIEVKGSSGSIDGEDCSKVLDGDLNTYWGVKSHDLFNNPATIEFALNNAYKLDKIMIIPKQYQNGSDSYKDRPLNYNLYTSMDGENYIKLIDNGKIVYADFNDNSAKFIEFNDNVTKFVRLEIISTTGDRIENGQGFSTLGISEIDFIIAEEVEDTNNNEWIKSDLAKAIINKTEPSERNKFFKLRNNLTNSYLKFSNNKSGTVGFIGGSITEASGWRTMTKDMIKNEFPKTSFNFVDAGIASFDSIQNVFRFDNDVIDKGPVDLLFIEAAVNDETNGRTREEIIRSFEGIIRQAYASNPYMDIVIMYFVDDWKIEQVNSGNTMPIVDIQEEVAKNYNITAIDMATQVIRSMNEGEYNWNDFGGLHPSLFGHGIYSTDIENLLKANWSTVNDETKLINHEENMPNELLDNKSYINGKQLNIKEAKNLSGFKVVNNWYPIEGDTRPGFVNVPMLEATKSGESFTLEFSGTSIGLRNVAGPYTGIIEYSVDGSPFKEVDLFTEWSSFLNLPWAHMLETNLDDTMHTLTIRTINKKNIRSKGYGCVIESFLINTNKVLFEEADFNSDGKVNVGDLSMISKNVGKNFESNDWRSVKFYDVNRDRRIDGNDVDEIMKIMLNYK